MASTNAVPSHSRTITAETGVPTAGFVWLSSARYTTPRTDSAPISICCICYLSDLGGSSKVVGCFDSITSPRVVSTVSK